MEVSNPLGDDPTAFAGFPVKMQLPRIDILGNLGVISEQRRYLQDA